MLDKNIKYVYKNEEKFKASYKQSMSTGSLFFDVSVSAATPEELKNLSNEAITACITVCNHFNEKVKKSNTKKKATIEKTNAKM